MWLMGKTCQIGGDVELPKDVAEKIRRAVKESGDSQQAFAKKNGLAESAISKWTSGDRNPSLRSLKKIAEATGKPLNYFFEDSQPINKIELQKIPILGVSSATREKFILEEAEGFLNVPKSSPNQFAIRVEGDCMVDPDDPENSIYHGNYIVVDPDIQPVNGHVVVARIDTEYSTIKRMFVHGDTIRLVPDNPKCETITKPLKDIKIIGKVVNVHKLIKTKQERV